MSIPARVAAEAAAADVQLADLAKAAREGTLEQDGPPQPTNPSPTPIADPATPPAPPAPAPAPAPTAQPVDSAQLLLQMQQRMSTMEGRLAAEAAARATAERELAESRRAPPTPPTPAVAPVSDTERTEFGEETVGFITKLAQHYAAQATAQLGSRIAALEGRLNQTHEQVQHVARVEQQTVADRYFTAVNSSVPDFEAINISPDFIEWLQNTDKASNKAYIDLLTAAHEQGNAGPVIHIFNLYKQEKGLGPASTPPPTQTLQTPGYIDPATLAAPSTTAPSPPPSGQTPQGKVWTSAEVDKLYKDLQDKNISRASFEAQEADYMKALVEGRVQQ